MPVGQLVRFGMTSVTSSFLTVGIPVVLRTLFALTPQLAAAIAFSIAFLVNFFSMRRLVFRSSNSARRDFLAFAGSSLVFRLLEYISYLILLDVAKMQYVLALILVLGCSTIIKFFWYRSLMS